MNQDQLAHNRHTLAHLLAQAVITQYPDAKLTLGPAIDNGFYYDVDFGTDKIGDEDLKDLQTFMRKHLSKWTEFTHREVSVDEAKKVFAGNEYKIELVEEIAGRGEKITLYSCGGFEDLCRGGHAENPAQDIPADSFKLDRVAGAYWKGDEKNKMLTRIYGLAFATKEELDAYIAQCDEARARDHKKLGRELDLFTFSELVGAGLPLWTPRGTLIRDLLDGFVWELRKAAGYERVDIPHITKKELYETSGHWDKFKDDLFRITTREGHEFAMKPMNCPHHTQIYARRQWSYRELPQRYASTTKVYRDEQSGELAGLSRVRSITQDDAHVFCRMADAPVEMAKIYDIVKTFYGTFGFSLTPRLSLHDPKNPDAYLGTPEVWQTAESALRKLVSDNGDTAIEALGEAAFYGPKIDFMAKDAIGREWQVATIQLDMNMPERFDLFCVNDKGEHERIVMIHAAIMGSIERFMSTLIEHTAGAFPIWLCPTQVTIVPIAEPHNEFAEKVFTALKEKGVRVKLDDGKDSMGKRIRNSKTMKVPYTIVIGDKERDAEVLTIETRTEKIEGVSIEDFATRIQKEIAEKTLN